MSYIINYTKQEVARPTQNKSVVKTMPHKQEFVTIKQASDRLGVSPRTIRRWVADIGTRDITRGTAKRHSLEVDISALKQHKGQVTQGTSDRVDKKDTRVAQDKKARKNNLNRVDRSDITDMQDIVPKDQYVSVLESKNEIIKKQDKHIATLESQLQNEREQRKRSDILLAETLQKIPQLEAPVQPRTKQRKKFLGIF